ncbi:MAG: hypothetical protein ABI171_08030 [Collimonas sp.]|uniref:antitoxin PaaA2 family protein n=1 Tax=Collimonas sp. TaxID=1963772 RepID=UPI00326435BA
MAPDLITPNILKELVAANAVNSTSVIGDQGGYIVRVRYGALERLLAARSNKGELSVRKFASLDAVDHFLRVRVNLTHYEVDSKDFTPAERKPRYALAAERLKLAHQAAAYDKWLKAEIQEAIDDPRPSIPDDEVKRHFANKREALRKRITAEPS